MLSDATFLRQRDLDVAEKAEQENDQEMERSLFEEVRDAMYWA